MRIWTQDNQEQIQHWSGQNGTQIQERWILRVCLGMQLTSILLNMALVSTVQNGFYTYEPVYKNLTC